MKCQLSMVSQCGSENKIELIQTTLILFDKKIN